jgi:hypothetical protein
MKRNVKLGAVPFLALLSFIVAMFVGWCMNVYQLFEMIGEPLGTEFVLRIVGVFVAPMGSIMGLFF